MVGSGWCDALTGESDSPALLAGSCRAGLVGEPAAGGWFAHSARITRTCRSSTGLPRITASSPRLELGRPYEVAPARPSRVRSANRSANSMFSPVSRLPTGRTTLANQAVAPVCLGVDAIAGLPSPACAANGANSTSDIDYPVPRKSARTWHSRCCPAIPPAVAAGQWLTPVSKKWDKSRWDKFHQVAALTHLESVGKTIRPNDLLIAAHCLAEDLVAVTANAEEFGRVPGLKVENWPAT